jgi:hypothetical protein
MPSPTSLLVLIVQHGVDVAAASFVHREDFVWVLITSKKRPIEEGLAAR